MNSYICFYKNKQKMIYADTAFEAQEKAAILFKAKKSWEIHTVLVKVKDRPITQPTDF